MKYRILERKENDELFVEGIILLGDNDPEGVSLPDSCTQITDWVDDYGNLQYKLDDGNLKKVKRAKTYNQKLQSCYASRCSEYLKTDSLFFEALYDGTPEKLASWKKAVEDIKNKYPKPKLNLIKLKEDI